MHLVIGPRSKLPADSSPARLHRRVQQRRPQRYDGAAPWIVKNGGNYYYIESKDNGIYVYRSTALTSPKQNPVKVWTAPASGWNETNIWAPELHHIGNHWYIYYAGGQRHANGS